MSFALAEIVSFGFGPRRAPSQVELRIRGTTKPFLERFVIGLAVGTALGLAIGLSAVNALGVGLSFGLALGSFAWLEGPTDPDHVASPKALLIQDRIATSSLALAVSAALGIAGGLGVGSAADLAFGVFGGLSGVVVVTPVVAAAGAAVGGLAYGRVGVYAFGAAGAVMGMSVFGPAYGVVLGTRVGTLFGLMFGLSVAAAVVLSRAWGAFGLSRLWFVSRGEVPLRLLRFLEDAHQRGVLRQTGGTYQFRHARLQDRLADAIHGVPGSPEQESGRNREEGGNTPSSPSCRGGRRVRLGARGMALATVRRALDKAPVTANRAGGSGVARDEPEDRPGT